ncbi:hypothetical protein AVEN_55676-1 [Araneus ventricosus]|uniref:Uncharacterized protein n=1 Tax=Araneus ventricosus TaxID=182803 RepID=A0A4Y2IXN2_ARAVE|nr:hypothetical protein AVEN_55676-1 [Araneus ventricosus]
MSRSLRNDSGSGSSKERPDPIPTKVLNPLKDRSAKGTNPRNQIRMMKRGIGSVMNPPESVRDESAGIRFAMNQRRSDYVNRNWVTLIRRFGGCSSIQNHLQFRSIILEEVVSFWNERYII